MGKVARFGLGAGIAAAGIASGAGWFTGAFWKQAGLYAATSFLGAKLNPQSGPRLDDLGVQLAQEGADLPRGWGRWRQTGVLVWCPGLTEHREGGGIGKGAPAQTEWKYSTSSYVLLGGGSMTQLERIRLNEKVEYDYNNGNEKPYAFTKQGNLATGAWKWVKEGDGKVRIYPGTLGQPVDSFIESIKGVGQWTNYPNLRAVMYEDCNLDDYGGRLPNGTYDCYNAQTNLAAICSEITSLRGYSESEVDFYELQNDSIAQSDDEGYVLASRRAASAALDELGYLFNFTLRERNGVLEAIKRGRVAVAVLKGRDILARADNEESAPLVETLADEEDVANVEEITFSDAGREGNPGMRRAIYPGARDISAPGARGGRRTQTSVTFKMRGGRALRAAQIHLGEKWAARETYPLSLSPRFVAMCGGDVIQIETPDGPREVILPLIGFPFFGALSATAPVQDRILYQLGTPLDGGDSTSSPLPSTPETPIGFAVDCVALDSDSPDMSAKPNVLLAATQLESNRWAGSECNVEVARDGGWKKDYDVTLGTRATMGYLRSAWTPSVPESGETTGNAIPGRMYYGDLHSASSALAHNGANVLVFETGLVVSFRTATAGAGTDFDVDGLRCGIYGSDYAEASVQNRAANGTRAGIALPVNTKFVLFRDEEGDLAPGVAVTGFGPAIIGQNRRFTFTPHSIADPYSHAQSIEVSPLRGRSFEPVSPVATATRVTGGGLRLVGHARTRYPEFNTDDPTRLSERATATGFKYRVTVISGSSSGTLDKYTSSAGAAFDFTLTVADIATATGRTTAQVAAETLSGDIRLWGEDFGFGRKTTFALAPLV
jgi:hypothetical protein